MGRTERFRQADFCSVPVREEAVASFLLDSRKKIQVSFEFKG